MWDEQGGRAGLVVGDYFGLCCDPPAPEVQQWFFGAAPPEVRASARRFRVPVFFRTLGEYFNTLIDAGFVVERICEPYACESTAREFPYVADSRLVPMFLICRCRI